jgi:HEPN domain-containing protein
VGPRRRTPVERSPLAARDLQDKAKVLDNYYVATQYANGHTEGAPFEHYGRLQSEEAIRYAGGIVEFVRARLADQGRSR